MAASVREDVLDGDHPTMAGLQPLSRLGRDEWGLPPEVFRITRPGRPEDIPGRGTKIRANDWSADSSTGVSTRVI